MNLWRIVLALVATRRRERKSTLDKMKERFKEGDSVSDMGNYVQSLTEQFVRNGIKDREPLIDAVHGELKKVDPDITRREAMGRNFGLREVQTVEP